jgi:hypothetical protein
MERFVIRPGYVGLDSRMPTHASLASLALLAYGLGRLWRMGRRFLVDVFRFSYQRMEIAGNRRTHFVGRVHF